MTFQNCVFLFDNTERDRAPHMLACSDETSLLAEGAFYILRDSKAPPLHVDRLPSIPAHQIQLTVPNGTSGRLHHDWWHGIAIDPLAVTRSLEAISRIFFADDIHLFYDYQEAIRYLERNHPYAGNILLPELRDVIAQHILACARTDGDKRRAFDAWETGFGFTLSDLMEYHLCAVDNA